MPCPTHPLRDLLDSDRAVSAGLSTAKRAPGAVEVIRVADLPQHVGLIRQATGRIGLPEPPKSMGRATVEEGDVVLVGRGAGFRVGIVGPEVAGKLISNNLIRIRPHKMGPVETLAHALDPTNRPIFILSGVLAAYLRSPRGEHELSKLSRSSTVLMSIRVRDLLNLPVPVLPLALQLKLDRLVLTAGEQFEHAVEAATLRHDLAMQTIHTRLEQG